MRIYEFYLRTQNLASAVSRYEKKPTPELLRAIARAAAKLEQEVKRVSERKKHNLKLPIW